MRYFVLVLMLVLVGCQRDKEPDKILLSKGVLNGQFLGFRDTITVLDSERLGLWEVVVVGDDWLKVQKVDDQRFAIEVSANLGTSKREAMISVTAPSMLGEVRVYQARDARGCPRQTIDSMALVALYNSTGGKDWYFEAEENPDSKHKRWAFDKPFYTWVGVECVFEKGQRRVAILNIESRGAVGHLPDEFDSLTMLKEFYASGNHLDVSAFAKLCKFKELALLDLSYNDMKGDIPSAIGSLEGLSLLNISGNNWTSDFPSEMLRLTSLTYLDASDCSASFTFSPLRYNINLLRLNLSNNRISGNVPEFISNFAKLEELNLAGNLLDGSLPGGLGLLTQLRVLNLAYNKLSGIMSTSFGRLQQLVTVNLAGNMIGSVERGALNSGMLENIDFSNNDIETFGLDGANLGAVKELLLSGNRIKVFSGNLSGMKNLELLNLSDNAGLGSFPVGIEGCTKLDVLSASGCGITAVGDLSTLTVLKSLDLSNNKISGPFGQWLCRMNGLVNLNLGGNNIIGTLPADIVNIEPLRTFVVRGNRMSGILPDKILDDKRCKGGWVTIPWEQNPTETRTFFVRGVWDSWRRMWPQQTGYGFENVPPEPSGDVA